MIRLLVCLSVAVAGVSCQYEQLMGSEPYMLEPQEKKLTSYHHKPLLSHYLAPFFQHPWAHKLAALSYIQQLKPTVTRTKTVVLQTVRHEKKHLICYKAHQDLPPCLSDYKEAANDIVPTAVPDYPQERNTQFLGYLEGAELKQEENLYREQDEYERQQRHIFGNGIFISTKYITNTLWVTKVEDYVNTQVTATLLAANCVPSDSHIPPCPEKVEHYVHYDLSDKYKPVWEKKKLPEGQERQKEASRGNSKEYVLEDRSGVESSSPVSEKVEDKIVFPGQKSD